MRSRMMTTLLSSNKKKTIQSKSHSMIPVCGAVLLEAGLSFLCRMTKKKQVVN